MDERLMKADCIVFDIGNVLLRFRLEKVCTFFPEHMRSAMHEAMFMPDFGMSRWDMFDLGVPDNETIAKSMAEAAGFKEAKETVLQFLEAFPRLMDEMPLYRMLPELKAMGKRIYALTNYPEPSFSRTLELYPHLQLMDGVVVSSREKMKKPDERIFRLIAKRYAIVPEETLFIDDRADNIAAAARVGYKTWHYQIPTEML